MLVKRRNPTPPRIRKTDAPQIGILSTADSGISSDEQIPVTSQGVILNSSRYLENDDANQPLSSSVVANLINKVRETHMRSISNAASKPDSIVYSDDEEDTRDSPTTSATAQPYNCSHFDILREWGLKATKAIIYVICAPFLLCCDAIHSGFNLATSLITTLLSSKKWASLKDTWSGYSNNSISEGQPRTHKKALKFGLLLILLSLLFFVLYMLKDHMSTSPVAELGLNIYMIISSMFSAIWSCLAGLSKSTMGFVDSTYYFVKTGFDSSEDVSDAVGEAALFQPQNDFKIQFEATLDLLLKNEKFASRIKEWSSMDDARLEEVFSRIEVQENALKNLMNEHKHQAEDQLREVREKIELTNLDTHERLSFLSNNQFPSIKTQINSIEQTLTTEESKENSIFETLQSEITEIQHQVKQLKEKQSNHSENSHHRKSDVLLKLEDFEARLNSIVSEQAYLSKTISGCSNTFSGDSLDTSDGSLLKERISKVLSDIFDENMSDNADFSPSKLKEYISQLNSMALNEKDMLTKDQLQVQLTEASATWKKQVLDEIQPQILTSSNTDITKNKQLKEAIEKELNDILKHHQTTIKDERAVQVGDVSQFSEEEVSRIIKTELVTYDADKTGKFDFALESAGGTIVSTRCTQTYDAATAVYSIWGIPIWWESVNGPRAILQPGANPGQCWAVKGDGSGVSGRPISVVIELSDKITVDSITLEHIPETLSPDGNIKSAPKEFSVLGLNDINDSNPVVLGNFTYVIGRRPVQTFKIALPGEKDNNAVNKYFSLIELKVHSNYGNPIYTCIYRFRVHGNLAPDTKTNFR